MKRAALALATLVLPVGANAALTSVSGGLGVYDSANDVTWTADGNLFATQAASYNGGAAALAAAVIAASGGVINGTPNAYDPSGIHTLVGADFNSSGGYGGYMTWWGALAWVRYLNTTNYGGSSHWALPTTVDGNASVGFPDGVASHPAQSSSQLAQLFYGGMGQTAGNSIFSSHNAGFSLFRNLQSTYISGTEYAATHMDSWEFYDPQGSQAHNPKHFGFSVLAVTPGNLGSDSATGGDAPLPLWALGLLAAGLLCMVSRQMRTAA